MPLINLAHAQVLVDGVDHPEGVTIGPDGMAYAGGEAGQIYRIDVEQRTAEQISSTGTGLNAGLALDKAGNIYVCNVGSKVVNIPAVSYADIRHDPEVTDSGVRFVQTAGGRTGAPRAIRRRGWRARATA